MQVWSTIYSCGPDIFRDVFLGPDGEQGVHDYWESMAHLQWAQNHPGFSIPVPPPESKAYCVAMGVHADKGQHIKRDKMLNIAWGSVHTVLPTLWSKMLFTVVPDDLVVHDVTFEQLYSVLVWSFWVMMLGVWPATDHKGNPWPKNSRRAMLGENQVRLAGNSNGTF